MKKTITYVLISCCFITSLYGADLMDVYRQALENDTSFKAAYSDMMANSEVLPQAKAALMPQLLATSSVSRTKLLVSAGFFSGKQIYDTNTYQLTASQDIFNYQSWAKVQQAKASVKAAYATFNNASQDLIIRTADAYLTVLYAQDTLNFAEAKLRANKRQLDQAQQRFNVGMDAITSVYEAKAAYDQTIAEVISAKNNKINQNENLRKLTNYVYKELSSLKNNKIPLLKPEPANVNDWVDTGLKQNYRLLSTKYNLQAARENIKAQGSRNWPIFKLQGQKSHTFNTANSNDPNSVFVPSKQNIESVALQVSFPFYQGGLVESQTRQAKYNFQTASEQLEQTYREIAVSSQIAYNTIIDGISKVKADRQTIISQTNSLDSTEAQFQAGTRTMVDVVNAQQRLFEAQEQLARDQYNFIRAVLNLKYLAGSLNVADLEEVNSWLNTTRINALPPNNKPIPKKTAAKRT
jgi:outer membrane protein